MLPSPAPLPAAGSTPCPITSPTEASPQNSPAGRPLSLARPPAAPLAAGAGGGAAARAPQGWAPERAPCGGGGASRGLPGPPTVRTSRALGGGGGQARGRIACGARRATGDRHTSEHAAGCACASPAPPPPPPPLAAPHLSSGTGAPAGRPKTRVLCTALGPTAGVGPQEVKQPVRAAGAGRQVLTQPCSISSTWPRQGRCNTCQRRNAATLQQPCLLLRSFLRLLHTPGANSKVTQRKRSAPALAPVAPLAAPLPGCGAS